jgi:outer membrane protein assembly factor BamB
MTEPSTARRWWARLGRVLVFGGVATVVGVVISWAIGVRVELDGGNIPRLTMYDDEAHFAALESDRAAQPIASPGAIAAAPDRRPEALWPAFRGAARDGRYAHSIRTDWPADGLPLLWHQPIGGGYASFVVADDTLFTIEQRRNQEVVTAYDPDTGRERWSHGWEAFFQETMGGDGPRATPTWHDGRLFALGAAGELRSLNAATGSQMWRTDILTDAGATNLTWAMSASPLIVDGLVVVLPGGGNGRSVAAYDAQTGDIVWTALSDVQGYTAPMLVELAGVRQILVVTAERAAGLRVDDGTLLWEFPWVTSSGPPNISLPVVVGGNRVFLSAGYGHGGALFEVTGSGGRLSTRELWRTTRMKNRFSTSVLYEGYLYGLDESILACLDAETGELAWKGGRYGHGQVLLADGHLVVLTERGDLVLVRATPEGHEEVARFDAISGKTWNPPTIADGRLYVRNTTEMAAFDIAP